MEESIICPICGNEIDELFNTEGMVNGGLEKPCCSQCLNDYDIRGGMFD